MSRSTTVEMSRFDVVPLSLFESNPLRDSFLVSNSGVRDSSILRPTVDVKNLGKISYLIRSVSNLEVTVVIA
jgi:hypothetical protein